MSTFDHASRPLGGCVYCGSDGTSANRVREALAVLNVHESGGATVVKITELRSLLAGRTTLSGSAR